MFLGKIACVTLMCTLLPSAHASQGGKFLGAVGGDAGPLHKLENTSSARSLFDLPTFTDCYRARDGIMQLPGHLRWEYDCARTCFWPCAGGAGCDCACSRQAHFAAIAEGREGFEMPKNSAGVYEGPQCFALKPAPPLTTTTAPPTTTTRMTTRDMNGPFEVSSDEILKVAGLSGEVHEFAQLEERHLHGFEERIVVADIHYSPRLGNGTDHARVYTRGCTKTAQGDEFCDACAIAFTATTDPWDFEEDLNINLVPFCGLSQVHAGFVEEMRSYMNQPNWATALSMMTTDKCQTAYAVGTSLGGAMASLFAFCTNQATVTNDADKAKFTGHFDIIPMTFGAPAIAKQQVYNGRPGQCFRGARVVISQPVISELNATKTITGISIIKGFLEIYTKRDHDDLSNAVARLTSSKENADEFAKLKMEVFENTMPSVILELKELLMTILVPSGSSASNGTSGTGALMAYAEPLMQLLPLATMQTIEDVLPALLNQPAHLSPNSDFAFEYDVTPGLLSGFNFQHAMVPYYQVAHPEGQQPDYSFATGACDASVHQPEADFLKVFYATLGSFIAPVLAKSGRGGFPNHHLCCYFRGLTGEPRGSCGINKISGSSYTCDAPSWR